jgi:hypothetical protein
MARMPEAASQSERPDPHADDAIVGPHGEPDDHGGTHGHDDHAHGTAAVGPLDVRAWTAAAVGVLLGLLVVLALIQAAN